MTTTFTDKEIREAIAKPDGNLPVLQDIGRGMATRIYKG